VAEFGCVDRHKGGIKAFQWADQAFAAMLDRVQGDWPNLIGFSWWNESWRHDWEAVVHDPKKDSNMLVQENPELAHVFQDRLRNAQVDLAVRFAP
jgi:hypothetical protein